MTPDLTRPIRNTARRFGSSQDYYPGSVRIPSGKVVPALFTADQLNDAVARAKLNPEDAPDVRPWWRKLLG